MSTTTKSPIDRAIAAGRVLLEEGEKATASAIRTKAGVSMAAAVEAARVLRHEQDAEEVEPEASAVPAAVTAAAEKIWQAAEQAARAALATDREAYLARIRETEQERDEARAERDEAIAEVDRLAKELARLSKPERKAPARRTTKKTAAAETAPTAEEQSA